MKQEIQPSFILDQISIRPLALAMEGWLNGTTPYLFSDSIQTEMKIDDVFNIVADLGMTPSRHRSSGGDSSVEVLYRNRGENTYLSVLYEGGNVLSAGVYLTVISANQEYAQELMQALRAAIPNAEEVKDESQAPVHFTYQTVHGVHNRIRKITVPTWSEIAQNYTASVRRDIDWLVAGGRSLLDEGRGKLLVASGKPGTGKTFVLRSLVREWQSWCDSYYITDPEKFFRDPDYLMYVMLEESSAPIYERDNPVEIEPKSRYKLIILEDAGELIAVDAKQQNGQALSRLLNVTEGMIGQGLNVVLFVTTNEDIGKLNPAVSRQGRCLSVIKFSELTPEEGADWLVRHGVEHNAPLGRKTLADLFAIKMGYPVPELSTVGF